MRPRDCGSIFSVPLGSCRCKGNYSGRDCYSPFISAISALAPGDSARLISVTGLLFGEPRRGLSTCSDLALSPRA